MQWIDFFLPAKKRPRNNENRCIHVRVPLSLIRTFYFCNLEFGVSVYVNTINFSKKRQIRYIVLPKY